MKNIFAILVENALIDLLKSGLNILGRGIALSVLLEYQTYARNSTTNAFNDLRSEIKKQNGTQEQ